MKLNNGLTLEQEMVLSFEETLGIIRAFQDRIIRAQITMMIMATKNPDDAGQREEKIQQWIDHLSAHQAVFQTRIDDIEKFCGRALGLGICSKCGGVGYYREQPEVHGLVFCELCKGQGVIPKGASL